MKKVLIGAGSFPPDFTGAGLRALRLCERMSKNQGVLFRVLCRKNAQKYEESANDKIKITRLRLVRETGLFFPIHLVQVFFKASIYLAKNKKDIDAIHFFSFPWINRMIMLSNILFYKKKTILEVTLNGDDDPASLLNKGIRNKLFKWLTKLLLKRVDQFVVPSSDALESCLKTGVNKDKVWSRPHPVDDAIFASISLDKKEELRKELGLPNTFIMLNIGMIYPRKNQMFLIKCLEKLMVTAKSKKPKANPVLLLIGPKGDEGQAYYDQITDYINKHGLQDNVLLLGVKKNINEYMIASDLNVFASSSEGFPNVVAESMVSGLPTVALDLECLNPLINEQTGTVIYRSGKTENELEKEFTDTIRKVYEGKTRYSSQKVRLQGLKLFSSKKADEKYYQIYGED